MVALAWIQLAAALACVLAAGLLVRQRSSERMAADLAGRELTPLRIREFFQTTRKELRAYCALLEATQAEAERALAGLDPERREALAGRLRPVQAELKRIHNQCDYPDLLLVRFPRVEPEAIARLDEHLEAIQGQLSLPPSAEARRLSASLKANYKYGLDQNTLFSDHVFSRGAGPSDPRDTWVRPENGE